MAGGAGFSDITQIATPAGAIVFVSPLSSSEGLVLNPRECTGLGTGEVRAAIDNRAGESGYILHPEWYEEGSIFVLSGILRYANPADRNTAQADTKTKLRSMLAATGTLSFSGAPSATVRWHLGCDFPAIDAHLKGFKFGVISADPW